MGEALKRNTRALNLFKPKIRHAKPWPKGVKANPNAQEKNNIRENVITKFECF